MYLICRPLYGLSYSWWSGDGVLVGAWCTVTKGGGVGWGRDIDQNLPWHQPLPPPLLPHPTPRSTLLSISLSPSLSPSCFLSLSNPFSPFLFLLLSRSTLPYPHLPSFLTPSLHSTERSASGSQSRISNGKRVLCAAARIIRMLLAARGKTRSLCRDYVTQPMVYFFESRVKRRKEENIGRCTRFNSSIYVETRQGCNKGRGMILMMTRD